MGVLSTSEIKIMYKAETAYASGKGTNAYDCTSFVLTDVGSLTAMSLIAGESTLGMIEMEREKIKAVGRAANSKVILDKGYRYKEMKLVVYAQSQVWIAAAVNASMGAIPTSYVFHVEMPGVAGAMDYFDICGCVLTGYDLEMSGADFVKETLTFSYYDIVDSVAITSILDFLSTAAATHKTFKLTIDGDNITTLKSCKLTVKNNTLDQMVATKYQRMDPYLIDRDFSVNAVFYDDAAATLGDNLGISGAAKNAVSAIRQTITISTNTDTNKITATNMWLDVDSLGKIPSEKGIIEYDCTFEQEDSTISYA